MEHGISDLAIYLNRMQKSVLDKLFFIDKVFEPIASIVDFGCANGELIKALQLLFGEYEFIGYDISEEMLEQARANTVGVKYYSDWNNINTDFSESLINISSTLHEVYSYCTDDEINEFWDRVFKSGFKYICLRDMMFSEKQRGYIDNSQLLAVRSDEKYKDKLQEYESIWGEITDQYSLTHFLLKYKYTQNWDREVRENYVPITIERLHSLIPNDYEITYEDHYTLPYTAWQIKNDFGITLDVPTHIKLVLKRK